MSASLVGSEMCIRDSCSSPPAPKKASANTEEPRRRAPLRSPGVARRHAASRHDAPRILLRNR
eukprot:10494477-Alexandrium_andersonii.AAC.1